MPHNENSRVKIPALVHFTRLGYKYISLRKYEGVIDDDTNILVDVLCDAINRINATSLTTTDVQKIVNALKAMLENDDLGREFYSVLINGYNGLKLIDFEDFGGTVNSYHVVTEMTCKNGSDEFRPDITPLINGIPLAFIEVKKPNNKGGIKAEYDRMLMRVKNKKFRRFINLTQIMVFSNNSEYDDTEAVPLEGAFYSTISYEKLFFSHFREEDEKLLTSVPEKDEAVENFILTDNNLSSIKYSPEYRVKYAENIQNGVKSLLTIKLSMLFYNDLTSMLNGWHGQEGEYVWRMSLFVSLRQSNIVRIVRMF